MNRTPVRLKELINIYFENEMNKQNFLKGKIIIFVFECVHTLREALLTVECRIV